MFFKIFLLKNMFLDTKHPVIAINQKYIHFGAKNSYLTGPKGQLKIFWPPRAIHNFLVGPLGWLKIFWRLEAGHIYLWLKTTTLLHV